MRMRIDAERSEDVDRVRLRARFALGCIGDAAVGVRFQVRREDGDGGGCLFRVRVCLQLRNGARVDVQECQSDLELAVDRALQRSLRTVRRRRERWLPGVI